MISLEGAEFTSVLRWKLRPQNHAMQCRQQEALASQAKSQLRSGHKDGHKQGTAHQHRSKGHGSGESAACCPLITDCDQAPFASVQPGMQQGLPAGLPQISATQQWNSEAHHQMGCVSDQQADSQQGALSAAHSLPSDPMLSWEHQPARAGTPLNVRASCVGPVRHGAQRDASQLHCSGDECQHSDPKELTWEGPLHAASGNVQAASGSGAVSG